MKIAIALTALVLLDFLPAAAQIPSGFVQTTATVSSLANGQYAASWTNLSSSPQLGLLGCVSTFQTTVNGAFDSNGHMSVLLADVAQICPTPSTWTFTLTYACPVGYPASAFQVAVAVTGGGGTEDITAQINAALPANPCGGGGVIPTPFPGPVCRVTDYGAVGNGTANDHDPIQAAIDACYANGGSVYFPTNFSNVAGTTVYYTATPINPKGVSMFGPPGAGGASNYYATSNGVLVRGAPGQDVFAVVPVGGTGYVAPRPAFTVQDIGIQVDNSIDVSASKTTRRPGRPCMDVVANGTAIITSAVQCGFMPGDVGQAIKVGSTTTTILSWQSATQVTLNTTVGAGTGLTAYISVFNLPVTQNIGNCAFAYDDPLGAFTGLGPDKAIFSDVWIGVTGSFQANNSCGFFFQGGEAPTHTVWRDNFVSAGFPFAFVPASGVAPRSSLWTGMSDFNVFDHVWISGVNPFLEYSGSFGTMKAIQISGAVNGPHFMNAYGVSYNSHSWTIDIPEIEVEQSSCAAGAIAFRIAGADQKITRLGAGFCNAGAVFQWDASGSSAELDISHLSTLNISGDDNNFETQSGADFIFGYGASFNITGRGNTWTTGSNTNPLGGIQPNRNQAAGGNVNVGPAQLSRTQPAFQRTHDFLNTGASAYYLNAEDLWLWPKELVQFAGSAPVVVNDANSETGDAVFLAANAGNFTLQGSNGTVWTIGSQIPAGKMRVYFKAYSTTGATSFTVYPEAWNGSTQTYLTSGTVSLTTSYAVYSFDTDATGYSGQNFWLKLGDRANNVYVAWVGIKPWDTNMTTTSIQLGSGLPLTDNQGNGAKLQHSTGSTTTNNCVKFDANGNTIDAGVSCSASGGFSSGSNANGRWVTDPTGTTTERGCINVTAGGTTHVTGAVTFPLTFPTAIDSYSLTAGNSPDGGDSGTAAASSWFTSISTSGATANYRCVVDVGGGGCSAISNTVPLCWIAIGR